MRNALFALMLVAMNASAQEVTDSTIFKELNIDEVTITASRIQQKVNGYVVNLKGEELVKGNNAAGVLELLPRVEKVNGKFLIDGKTVSEIYLNGLPIRDIDQLNTILGERLLNVEVEYTSGVNQKSSETGGIIRIKMEKPKTGGYYGNVNAVSTVAPANFHRLHGLRGMIYWGNEKWGIYSNGNLAKSHYRENTTEHIGSSASAITAITDKRQRIRGRSGYEYTSISFQPNQNHSFAASVSVNRGLQDAITTLHETDYQDVMSYAGNNTKIDAVVKYEGLLDEGKTQLVVQGEQLNLFSHADNQFNELQYATNIKKRSSLSKMKVELNRVLNDNLMLSTGGEMEYIDLAYRDWTPLSERLSNARNNSDIMLQTPLLFISLQGQYKRWQFMLGTNYQHNFIRYNDLGAELISKNHQWGINPQLNISYVISQKHGINWTFGYKRERSDIPYGDINASMWWLTPYLYTRGNPDLKATTGHSFQTAFSLFNNKISLAGFLGTARNSRDYETVEDTENPGVYVTSPVNREKTDLITGTQLNLNLRPVKVWQLNFTGRIRWQKMNNTVGGITYNGWQHDWWFSMQNRVSLSKTCQLALNGQYEPKSQWYGSTLYKVYRITGSISKQFNKHWECRLSSTMISRPRSYIEQSANAYQYHYSNREDRNIELTITYKFDHGKSVRHETTESIINVDTSTRKQ